MAAAEAAAAAPPAAFRTSTVLRASTELQLRCRFSGEQPPLVLRASTEDAVPKAAGPEAATGAAAAITVVAMEACAPLGVPVGVATLGGGGGMRSSSKANGSSEGADFDAVAFREPPSGGPPAASGRPRGGGQAMAAKRLGGCCKERHGEGAAATPAPLRTAALSPLASANSSLEPVGTSGGPGLSTPRSAASVEEPPPAPRSTEWESGEVEASAFSIDVLARFAPGGEGGRTRAWPGLARSSSMQPGSCGQSRPILTPFDAHGPVARSGGEELTPLSGCLHASAIQFSRESRPWASSFASSFATLRQAICSCST